MTQNKDYWMNEGANKTFTHPFYTDWLTDISANPVVLDMGCGYGRLTPEFQKHGFTSLYGYDFSLPLIERAKRENPGAFYTTNIEELTGRFYDLITCFALFTCCPSDTEQLNIISVIDAVTQQGATLYISDYETNDNPHYNDRYEQREHNLFGCFTSSTATFRHHEAGHFERLLKHWNKVEERKLESRTLNGNYIIVHQYLFIKVPSTEIQQRI